MEYPIYFILFCYPHPFLHTLASPWPGRFPRFPSCPALQSGLWCHPWRSTAVTARNHELMKGKAMGMFSTRNGNVYMILQYFTCKNSEIPINFRIGWGAYQETSAMKGNGPMWASLERTQCHGKWHRTAQTWHGEFVGCKGQHVLIWSCLLVPEKRENELVGANQEYVWLNDKGLWNIFKLTKERQWTKPIGLRRHFLTGQTICVWA